MSFTAPPAPTGLAPLSKGRTPWVGIAVGVALVVLVGVGFVWFSMSEEGLLHEPSTPPPGWALGVGGATLLQPPTAVPGCAMNHYCYTIVFASVSPAVTGGSINLQVRTSSGTVYELTGAGSAQILDIAGATVVGATMATATPFEVSSWTQGNSTTLLQSSDTLWLDLGPGPDPAGMDLTLTVFGIGSFSGSESVGLP